MTAPSSAQIVVTRDLRDMACTAFDIAIAVNCAGKALGDAHDADTEIAEGQARDAALDNLRQARAAIDALIAEIEAAS